MSFAEESGVSSIIIIIITLSRVSRVDLSHGLKWQNKNATNKSDKLIRILLQLSKTLPLPLSGWYEKKKKKKKFVSEAYLSQWFLR